VSEQAVSKQAEGESVSGAHRAEAVRADGAGVVRSLAQVPSAQAMRDLGSALATSLRAGDLVVLSGDLGAGKTTLTQGIGNGLAVRGDVTSPTFVIARVHPPLAHGPALVHVDAYRLASLAEVDDLDLDATLADSVTVVEWGEGLVEELAADRLEVRLLRPRGSDAVEGTAGPAADPAVDGADPADRAPADGDEPRQVELVGHGDRWRDVALPAG
jgi:tRNA threonylcarbamoyladenosine biosynthesis protein TsaE